MARFRLIRDHPEHFRVRLMCCVLKGAHAGAHQVCLAHVLRDVLYAVDADAPCFAPSLRRLLCWAIARRSATEDLEGRHLGPVPRDGGPPPQQSAGGDCGRGRTAADQTLAPPVLRFHGRPQRAADQQRSQAGTPPECHLPQSHRCLPLDLGRRHPCPDPIFHRLRPPQRLLRPSGIARSPTGHNILAA